jgi:hypothetical protein
MESKKIRKQIYLEADQDVLLKKLAVELNLSEAEIIRQAIDRHTGSARSRRRGQNAWLAERAYIENLIQQGPVVGQRSWRREDLYDR